MSSFSPLSELVDIVERADDSTLMMSRKHCHAKFVSSIVVSNVNGRLTRAFLAWHSHQLFTNVLGSDFAVGPHDHRYSIRLKSICGEVVNANYLPVPSLNGEFHAWEMSSSPLQGELSISSRGKADLKVASRFILGEDWHFMDAFDVHCLSTKDSYAAWWVKEGPVCRKTTRLFTMKEDVSTKGLYVPFVSADEVRYHVRGFARFARDAMV